MARLVCWVLPGIPASLTTQVLEMLHRLRSGGQHFQHLSGEAGRELQLSPDDWPAPCWLANLQKLATQQEAGRLSVHGWISHIVLQLTARDILHPWYNQPFCAWSDLRGFAWTVSLDHVAYGQLAAYT